MNMNKESKTCAVRAVRNVTSKSTVSGVKYPGWINEPGGN